MSRTTLTMFIVKDWAKIITVIGILGGIFTFIYNAYWDAVSRNRESRKPFLEQQLRTYTEAVETTSQIAGLTPGVLQKLLPSDEQYTSAVNKFWALYWGHMAIVEDGNVERAMIIFGKSLDEHSPCANDSDRSHIVLILSHCIRDSLAAGWGTTLPPVPPTEACSDSNLTPLFSRCAKKS